MSDCKLFYFVSWGVIGGGLCIFGFVGNTLSLFAFQKDKRVPATTLLQALAVSDFLLLLSVFITDEVPYVCDYVTGCVNPWFSWPFIRYIWILTPISHMCSIWFVVLIALNRYYAVCQALDMGTVWNNKRTPIYIMVVLFVVITFNLPRFFEYKMIQVPCEDPMEKTLVNHTQVNVSSLSTVPEIAWPTSESAPIYIHNTTVTSTGTPCTRWVETRTEFGSQSSYKVVYKVLLVNIILVLVPIVLLIAFTLKILVSLRETKKRIRTVKETNRNGVSKTMRKCSVKKQRNKKNSMEITVILTLVVVVAILCQAPLCVFHFVRYTASYKCGDMVFYLDNISKLLVNVNSSANFIIYCLFSPKFRKLLLSFWICSLCGLRSIESNRDYTSVSRRELSVRDVRTETILRTSRIAGLKSARDSGGSEEKTAGSEEKAKEVTFQECNGGVQLQTKHGKNQNGEQLEHTAL